MKNYWLNKQKRDKMPMKICKEVAARIWCDKEYSATVMDVNACLRIAKILHKVANK
jgi:hypothetical protein